LAQMVALVPGTSRAGITMTAALALGFDRLQAARYAFLLAIPVIALSGAYKATQLSQQVFAPWSDLAMGAIVAAAVALMTIHFFMALVNRVGMMPFVWYRLALGIFLLAFLYLGST
jgi:undecaprenyl-diphosphatase